MADTWLAPATPPKYDDHPTRRRYSAAYKVAILAEYDALDRDGKGRLLQREDLYTSLLSQWRKQRDRGARSALNGRPGRPRADSADREIARLRPRAEQLEAELDRARKVLENPENAARRTRTTHVHLEMRRQGSGRTHPSQNSADSIVHPLEVNCQRTAQVSTRSRVD